MSLILGQNTGESETLHLEYKEFRLCYSPGDDFKAMFDSLDVHVDRSTDIMIEKYVFKNVSSFINAKISGTLRLGITDNGTVIGIPTKNLASLVLKINKSISSIIQGVTTEIISVDPDQFISFDYNSTEEHIAKLEKINREFVDYELSFEARKKHFMDLLFKYRASLAYLFDNEEVYAEFKAYLQENGVYEALTSYLPPKIDLNEVVKYKHDPSHIIYWAVKFRDRCTNYILKEYKPTRDPSYRQVNVYYETIMTFLPMIPGMMDQGFKFYVVDLHVDPSKYDDCHVPCGAMVYKRDHHPVSGPFVSGETIPFD